VHTAVLNNTLYRVGQGALGMSSCNQGGGGPKKFWNHESRIEMFGNDFKVHK
jgi:hypothetical protein